MTEPKWQDRAVEALEGIANGLKALGNGNAFTEFGAIEAHSMQIKEGAQGIEGGLYEMASEIGRNADAGEEISSSLDKVADALNSIADAITKSQE